MTRRLRALLLAAGLGTRLPITETTPKCLVEVGGEPLLGRWLKQLEDVGCEAVLINTHYLAEQVEEFSGGETPQPHARAHHLRAGAPRYRRHSSGQPLVFPRLHWPFDPCRQRHGR